jgi:hypothetical protein
LLQRAPYAHTAGARCEKDKMKTFTAMKDYTCYRCTTVIAKGEKHVTVSSGVSFHEGCYNTNKRSPLYKLESLKERIAMNAQLYTLNEVTDALRHMMKENDSLEYHLKGGDFRQAFARHVTTARSKRDTGAITSLHDRLVPIAYQGLEVYMLDDIQGALNKAQFSLFVKLMKFHDISIEYDKVTYIPIKLVDIYIQGTIVPGQKTEQEEEEELPDIEEIPEEPEDIPLEEPSTIKFA